MISNDTYGILHRLLLNDPIDPSPEGLFRILGFVHVFSASGLHLLALESFLQRFIGRSLMMRKILTVCFWFFLLLIWKLQGFRLGFARVLVLFFLRALARVQGYRWRIYYPLFLAFCFDFATGIDSGWQHYYLAILGGMLGLEFARERGMFFQHIYLSVASWLMTAPLDLWQHHEIAWMTPVWSLITIPPIALVLYPLSILSYFILGRVPLFLMDIWNRGAAVLLGVVDQGFTFSVVGAGGGHLVLISLASAMIVASIFLYRRARYERIVLITISILIALMVRFRWPSSGTQLVQLDVGQGDSLLIGRDAIGDGRVEMIDLGTSRGVKPEVMVHRLAQYGVTHVDTVLFSHMDEDHAGGMRMLLPWVPTGHLEMNPRLERAAKVRSWLQDFPSTDFCPRGCFRLGSVDSVEDPADHSGNDLMATAIIPLSTSEVYLALGDADSAQESVFWRRHHVEVMNYSRRLLKVSHHGSRFSTSDEFLSEVSPSIAVISCGFHNHYHHPHFRVVEQLLTDRIPIHRTDRDGDFVWTSK